jgi:hypothetical protein
MAGLVPAIHVFIYFSSLQKDVDARDIGVLSTPFFERLRAGMTSWNLSTIIILAG